MNLFEGFGIVGCRDEIRKSCSQSTFLQSPGSRDGDRGVRVYLSCLAADPSRPGTILAAFQEEGYDVSNGRGLLISRDRGDTWEPFALDGLTCYRVSTLKVDPVNPARIYAGTGGNTRSDMARRRIGRAGAGDAAWEESGKPSRGRGVCDRSVQR